MVPDREARPKKGAKRIVGFWAPSEAAGTCAAEIGAWAQSHHLDGAVWTALGPKFDGVDGGVPNRVAQSTYQATRGVADASAPDIDAKILASSGNTIVHFNAHTVRTLRSG